MGSLLAIKARFDLRPASWQRSSAWLMSSDDNIWPLKLWLFLAALNGNYCGVSSVGRDQLRSDSASVAPFLTLSPFFLALNRAAPLKCTVIQKKTMG